MKYTENLLLELHNTTTDKSLPVITWRSSINGETDSAFIKIDKAFGELKEQMTKVSGSAIKVEATGDGLGNYSAINIDKIEEYKKDDVIALIPSVDCIGNSMLNINSLGNKSLMKVANDGTLVVLENGDLRANHEYYFRYNGSMFVWQIGTSAEQLNYCATEDSTLEATNVKDAIEELDTKLEILNKTRGYHTPQLQTDANKLIDSGKYVGFGDNLPDDGVWMVDVTASHRTYVDDITQDEITDIYIVQQAYKVCDTVGNRVEPIGKTRTCINDNWSTWNEVVLDDGKFDCIPDITVQGRTLVNLLGRSGNAIYQQDWTVSNTSITYTNDTFAFSGDGSISKDINTVSGNSYLVGYIRNGIYENNIIVASATTTTVSISVSDGDILSYIRAYQIENTETLENCTNEKYPYVDDVKPVVNPYFESDNSRIMFETKLYDGETITRQNDGTYVKNSEWEEIEINELLGRRIFGVVGNSGYHTVCIDAKDIYDDDIIAKLASYNGNIIINRKSSVTNHEHFYIDYSSHTDRHIVIILPNTLTGWGDNYAPTPEEIKAFLLGWRMGSVSDASAYNGTGQKQWAKLWCGVGGKGQWGRTYVVSGTGTTELPTILNDQGYTPYRLIYKKENPTIEEVKTYGGLIVKDGVDITSSSGLVLSERNISNSTNIYPKSRVENIHSIMSNNEILPFTNTLTTTSGNMIRYGKNYGVLSEGVDECFVDYSMYSSDTVTSYDYTLTYDNSIKSILNKTQNELITTKEELSKTKKELEHTKYELSQRSNPNLLINGDFQVWQRGILFDDVDNAKYTADRWRINNGYSKALTVQKCSKGLRIDCKSNTAISIEQLIEGTSFLRNYIEIGGKFTLSCKLNGNIISKVINLEYDEVRNVINVEISKILEKISMSTGEYFIFEWVKLELGEYATPFVSRPYVEELMLCERYNDDNIVVPYSNPNLLINGDFQVWQRGESFTDIKYSSTQYTSDRWQCYTANNATVKFNVSKKSDYGVKIDYVTATGYVYIVQNIECPTSLWNKKITLSYEGSQIYSNIFFNSNVTSAKSGADLGIALASSNHSTKTITTTVPYGTKCIGVILFEDSSTTTGFELNWAKLELGSVATPFVPRSYGEELLACQRYYEVGRVRRMALTTWHLSDTILQLKTQKRIKPTFKLKGDQSGTENVIDVLDEASVVESNINADKISFTLATNDDYSQYMIGSNTNCLTPNKRIGFIYEADAEIY